jgi:hypothetical protein
LLLSLYNVLSENRGTNLYLNSSMGGEEWDEDVQANDVFYISPTEIRKNDTLCPHGLFIQGGSMAPDQTGFIAPVQSYLLPFIKKNERSRMDCFLSTIPSMKEAPA